MQKRHPLTLKLSNKGHYKYRIVLRGIKANHVEFPPYGLTLGYVPHHEEYPEQEKIPSSAPTPLIYVGKQDSTQVPVNTHAVGMTAFTKPQTMAQPHGLQVVMGEDPQT